jgi:hypothetical protein
MECRCLYFGILMDLAVKNIDISCITVLMRGTVTASRNKELKITCVS